MASPQRIAIIIPVLNDGQALSRLLKVIEQYQWHSTHVIVVDGGSDLPVDLPFNNLPEHIQVLTSKPGRGLQQHHGAQAAHTDILWFLHADSLPDKDAPTLIRNALVHHRWGRFDIKLVGHSKALAVIAWFMNYRSAITGICTGDQGIFVLSDTYMKCQGFDPIKLMEDIALSKKLRVLGKPARIRTTLQSSGRRWDQHGVVKTVLLMWSLRLQYWLGADPTVLSKKYYSKSCAPD